MSARYQRWWARGLARAIDMRIEITGLEHVGDAAYVVTPLHEGLADALALLHLPVPLRFVLRDEFVDWRLIGGYLRDTGQIAIRPEDGLQAYRSTVRAAQAVTERGESVVICPQGTVLGIETDFQPGAFAVARALGRPILPVAVTGTHRVWEFPFSPRLRRGVRVGLQVLPPIAAEEVCTTERDTLRLRVQHRVKSAALDRTMPSPRHYVPERDGYWDGYAFDIDPAYPELAANVAAHRDRA
ncbi:MAG TPA: lysophospholipid acyltransferase family protein [Thermomicrobiales bacterium]|nr:lysophospholipid acyltransferase family protein [Thermomicrobiales bacterium]